MEKPTTIKAEFEAYKQRRRKLIHEWLDDFEYGGDWNIMLGCMCKNDTYVYTLEMPYVDGDVEAIASWFRRRFPKDSLSVELGGEWYGHCSFDIKPTVSLSDE